MKKINPSVETCDMFERGSVAFTVPSEERRCYACRFNLFAACWFADRLNETVHRAIYDSNDDAKRELLRRRGRS